MNHAYLVSAVAAAGCLSIGLAARVTFNTETAKGYMATHARGSFEVKLNPQAPDDTAQGVSLGRMSIEKLFDGDLHGTSKGEMLTAVTDVKGSAVYVAIERVTGTLNGRSGTFVLVHRGMMSRGAQELDVTVVPDSGNHQLTGLAGKMAITIVDGKHLYDFEYTLSESR